MGEREHVSRRRCATTPADVMVAVFDAAERAARDARWPARCARHGLRVLVYPDADKIGKQIKYADARGIPFVAMLGERRDRGRHRHREGPGGADAGRPTTSPRRARRFSRH